MTSPSDWVNPLRDDKDKRLRIADAGMVIFSVTGDLARKNLPAI